MAELPFGPVAGYAVGDVAAEPDGEPAPGQLPAPRTARFSPLRAGILNLWQYDEQELRFEQGRLLLRGDNGAGKSKALELLLPFLLDADLSPQRLDPFAGTARSMLWNLLQGDRYESRVGYVWLELGRTIEEGAEEAEECWTIGCGLRAQRRTERVDSWYFVTRRRIGGDLALVSRQRIPLLKDELRKAIGDAGDVYDTGREYRERLDHLFYNLGEERFAALRHLLLQLRRPQLSQKLDPKSLGELLTQSLPPLDPDLIGQLSETFERLDQNQRELARVEGAAREVEAFLAVYREHAQGTARARAAEVRQADSRYHKTASEVREAEADRERLASRESELGERRREVEGEAAGVEGELRALAGHEAMRSAEVLRARREQAESLERQAETVARDRGEAERLSGAARAEAEKAEAEARQAEQDRDGRERAAAELAQEAGLAALHGAALEALHQNPSAAEATARAAIDRRRKAVTEVQGLAGERRKADDAHARAEDRRAEAETRWRQAAARTEAADREADRLRGELATALAAWRSQLAALSLDEAGFAALQAVVLEAERSEGAEGAQGVQEVGASALLARLAEPQIDAEVRRLRDEEAAAAQLAGERRATLEERERVAASRDLGPAAPYTRLAKDRPARAGAPLYLLCDFAQALGVEERAGLEAALEGAGLLDAWVTPDGRLLAAGTLDTVLVAAPRDGAGTLAELLIPAPGHGVEGAVIEALLRSLDLFELGADRRDHWVARDGNWRLGPLHGAWNKGAAEHVGAAAREAARQRRLAELEARLVELERELAASEGRRQALAAGLADLRREVASFPSAEPWRRARLAVLAVAVEEGRRRDELGLAEETASEARRALEQATRRLEKRARELDLAGRLGDLPGYRVLLERYEGVFGNLVRAAFAADSAFVRRSAAAASAAAAEERWTEVARRAAQAAASARAARAEARTLEATVGEEARRIVEQHSAALARLEGLKRESDRLLEEREAAVQDRVRAETLAELLRQRLDEQEAARQSSVLRVREVAATGLLALVLDPVPEEAAGLDLTLTRALELARLIDRATAEVELSDEAVRRRANRLHERFQRLGADLGAEFQPSLRPDGDLILVRILYNGQELDPAGLLSQLREAAELRRGLLADQERETLRRFLLGEVGDHLRRRLRQAGELVGEMNDQLIRCATTSGMVLRLTWRPDAEAEPGIREVVELLRRDPDLLLDEGRQRLEAFFQRQIEVARGQWEAVPWRQHLMQALDYRRWHRFQLQRRIGADGAWQDLTRHGHAAISGGEKAVALHLPLFAAAAAHYRSASVRAPRLILLDEAFAGIDQTMRGRCMGLLVDFDLDFMMTSYDEWGCYEELPGLAIYQLYRDPAFEGVAAVPFLWNGRQLQEVAGGGGER